MGSNKYTLCTTGDSCVHSRPCHVAWCACTPPLINPGDCYTRVLGMWGFQVTSKDKDDTITVAKTWKSFQNVAGRSKPLCRKPRFAIPGSLYSRLSIRPCAQRARPHAMSWCVTNRSLGKRKTLRARVRARAYAYSCMRTRKRTGNRRCAHWHRHRHRHKHRNRNRHRHKHRHRHKRKG